MTDRKIHSNPGNEFRQDVSVAARLVLRTMTKQGDRPLLRERLQESQRKLLAVILDRAIPAIDRGRLQEFFAIATLEFAPTNPAGLNISQ
jgi:hypothetical protein